MEETNLIKKCKPVLHISPVKSVLNKPKTVKKSLKLENNSISKKNKSKLPIRIREALLYPSNLKAYNYQDEQGNLFPDKTIEEIYKFNELPTGSDILTLLGLSFLSYTKDESLYCKFESNTHLSDKINLSRKQVIKALKRLLKGIFLFENKNSKFQAVSIIFPDIEHSKLLKQTERHFKFNSYYFNNDPKNSGILYYFDDLIKYLSYPLKRSLLYSILFFIHFIHIFTRKTKYPSEHLNMEELKKYIFGRQLKNRNDIIPTIKEMLDSLIKINYIKGYEFITDSTTGKIIKIKCIEITIPKGVT